MKPWLIKIPNLLKARMHWIATPKIKPYARNDGIIKLRLNVKFVYQLMDMLNHQLQ